MSDTPSGGVVLDHVIARTFMLYWMSFRFVIVACLVIVFLYSVSLLVRVIPTWFLIASVQEAR